MIELVQVVVVVAAALLLPVLAVGTGEEWDFDNTLSVADNFVVETD